MNKVSIFNDMIYNVNRPAIKVLLDTDFAKEIRIVMRQGQVMKEHQTPFPIVVHIVKGTIQFGVNQEIQHLKKGDLIALKGKIPHNLKAIEDSIIRLSLNKADLATERLEKVIREE